ncbi:glycosyltransferase [Nocardioides litoris]|uniref:glycosyltransferase n=1 Tax=Nocardioides litoris TaxID=1926648 RepID=UPI0011201897|nr:glycosyltransferase [Nocardioides litoris]
MSASATLGGSERWLLDLLTTTDRLAPEVWLLDDGPFRAALEHAGVPVRVLPTGSSGRAVAARGLGLARRLRASGAEVVLANGVKAAAAAVPAARLVGVPVVWAKHDYSFDRRLARPLGRLADRVLALSAAVAEATGRDDVELVAPPRPAHEPTGRDAARAFWREHGLPAADVPTVALLGRLVGYKGIDTAVRALAEAGGPDVPWRVVVVGPDDPTEPEERARLAALAAEAGVADRLVLLDPVPDAGRHLAAFDAVAVLTRRSGDFGREGYSLVALEALAAGTPLIGSEGNPEVERMAREAGRVVPTDDPAAVARAVGELLDPRVAAACGTAGRRVVAGHHDTASWADRVVAVLAREAGRPGAGLAGPPMTVLTCLRNEEGHVDAVVSRVLPQLGPDDEYLLLDDGSTDGTPEEIAAWAARDHRVRRLSGPAINLSAARNHGFAQARHAHVACTDAGCEPAPTWLAALRAPFAEPDPVDLVVGVYDVDAGDPVRDAARVALFPSVAEARRRSPAVLLAQKLTGRAFSADRLDGRSMACTVAAWRSAGGFDVALRSSEDAVFGEAVRRVGGTSVLALDAEVVWEQTGRLRDMARMYATYGEWGGRAGSPALVGRDAVRGGAYLVGPALALAGGPRTRALVALAAASYVGLPAVRGRHLDVTPGAWPLVPVVVALKDVSKAVGCARGVLARLRERQADRG